MSDGASRALLERLIGFATVSRDSNLAMIDFIRDYLRGFGIESELFYNAERTKASLYATIGPRGGGDRTVRPYRRRAGRRTDLDRRSVPAHGTRRSPVRTRDRRHEGLHRVGAGRGACIRRAVLREPVHLAFSYDEEIGCVGVRPMLEALAQRADRPRLCVIGEPTELKPVLGHKGKLAMRCHVKGAACHSAYAPSGVNAIHYAAKLIGRLGEIGDALARPEHRDGRFDPPFSTVQAGLIDGGRALNIVPAECTFDFEVRALPGFDAENVPRALQDYAETELLPAMRAVQPDTDIRLQPLGAYPGLATARDTDAARLLAMLTGSDAFGTVAFGTEGGLFGAAGIPAVVCGPGSMDQGHKPDEFVTLAQLHGCDAMLARLAAHLAQRA